MVKLGNILNPRFRSDIIADNDLLRKYVTLSETSQKESANKEKTHNILEECLVIDYENR